MTLLCLIVLDVVNEPSELKDQRRRPNRRLLPKK
jgi:hypothetical protein